MPSPPLIPEPNADQLLPFHLAILVAASPPAVVKSPPAYRSLPDTVSAYTPPFIPEPSADQLLPFHLAILVAALPPAVVKAPPAYTLLPNTASADTEGTPPLPPVPIPEP